MGVISFATDLPTSASAAVTAGAVSAMRSHVEKRGEGPDASFRQIVAPLLTILLVLMVVCAALWWLLFTMRKDLSISSESSSLSDTSGSSNASENRKRVKVPVFIKAQFGGDHFRKGDSGVEFTRPAFKNIRQPSMPSPFEPGYYASMPHKHRRETQRRDSYGSGSGSR